MCVCLVSRWFIYVDVYSPRVTLVRRYADVCSLMSRQFVSMWMCVPPCHAGTTLCGCVSPIVMLVCSYVDVCLPRVTLVLRYVGACSLLSCWYVVMWMRGSRMKSGDT